MRISKEDVAVKLEIPGAVIRQQTDFGDATGLGKISCEYFTLSTGVDTTPLFQGLEGDLCQCPHWGSYCAVNSPQLTRMEHRNRSMRMTSFIGHWPQRKGQLRRGDHHVQSPARARPRHQPHDKEGERLIQFFRLYKFMNLNNHSR